MITSVKSPVTRVYEKMYTSSLSQQEMQLISEESAKVKRIKIGNFEEEKQTTSPSSVPSFLRNSLFASAKEKRLIPATTTAETIDLAALLRSSATIRRYYAGREEVYITPKGCMIYIQSLIYSCSK